MRELAVRVPEAPARPPNATRVVATLRALPEVPPQLAHVVTGHPASPLALAQAVLPPALLVEAGTERDVVI